MLEPSSGKYSIAGEVVAFACVGGVSSVDPLSEKYSIVGEGGAVGPAVGCKIVTLACDGGNNDDTFPELYCLEEVAIMIVLIGVSVTKSETK